MELTIIKKFILGGNGNDLEYLGVGFWWIWEPEKPF